MSQPPVPFEIHADGSVRVVNGLIKYVHSPSQCAGRDYGCWIHHPLEHPLWKAPVWFEPGRTSRICPHDQLHPDPQDVAFYHHAAGRMPLVHECDGCCLPVPEWAVFDPNIDPHTGQPWGIDAPNRTQTGETVERLTATDTGEWVIWTQGSQHVWKYTDDAGISCTRMPKLGRPRMSEDNMAHRVRTVDRWPVLGDVYQIELDIPFADPWRQSSTIRRIEKVTLDD